MQIEDTSGESNVIEVTDTIYDSNTTGTPTLEQTCYLELTDAYNELPLTLQTLKIMKILKIL